MTRLAVLVACFNRHRVTLPNLGLLIDALTAAGVGFEVHLLDDASPDETGRLVKERFPAVHVVRSEGDLFWNRGMRRIFEHAVRHRPFDGYLLFNDDVAVDAAGVAAFLAEWRRLHAERPTTLVGATRASNGDRITYSGFRLRSRHRPLSNRLVPPGETAITCDTFNGNFVLIPAATLEALGGNDPVFWHMFGDIDLGLSIGRRGERVMLAPVPIGRCDDRPSSAPSRHGLFTRLRKGLTGREDPRQHIHLIYKHAPNPIGASALIGVMLAKRLWVLVANKGHVMPGSADAKA